MSLVLSFYDVALLVLHQQLRSQRLLARARSVSILISLFFSVILCYYASLFIALFSNGVKLSATFNQLRQMAFDSLGNLYVVDGGNYIARKISTTGIVSTVAGTQGQSMTRTLT